MSIPSDGVSDPFRMDGRVALVSGASSGLGRHFAGVLARAGARVALGARRADETRKAAEEIAADGGTSVAVPLDVTDQSSIDAALDAIEARFGKVDTLVNNAGVASAQPSLDVDGEAWDRILDTNLKGAWLLARACASRLVAGGAPGAIVNIASIVGHRVSGGLMPYAVSKAGMVHMTRVLAMEWARHGIRVNAIAPGYIETDLNREFLRSEAGERLRARVPQRRFGEPDDLDGALLLLASDAGRFITGVSLPVDGGHLVNSL
ncbi:MAG: glucose 1-dehydrogenase [Acidobacteria bacterium]|nr:glucose 1-dehydrogenase [Acidobacteriota bacterium]